MDIILLSDTAVNESGIGNSRYLGAYVLASRLRREGLEVQVVDFASQISNLIETIAKIATPKTRYIGFSSTFMTPTKTQLASDDLGYYRGVLWFSQAEEAKNWFKVLRQTLAEKNSHPRLVVGGAKSLYLMFKAEAQTLFDYFVIGSAEESAIDLYHHLNEGTPIKTGTFQNATYIGASAVEEQKTPLQLTLWNPGDRIRVGEALPIELTRGCLYNCKFCHFDKQFSVRKELGLLKEEFIRNYELYGTRFYHFSDDCFNDRREKVEAFCELFLSLPIKIEWSSYARVDVACRFPATLDLMVESGARALFWGIETLNTEVARKVGKGTPSELVKEMFERSRVQHFNSLLHHGSFIIGLPGEDRDSVARTIRWITDSKALDFVSLFPLSLRPYSAKLDKAIVDYADFSRNPSKYGFQKIEFEPRTYWEHDKMNLPEAMELANNAMKEIKAHGINRSFVTSAFQYPHLRGLGYTQEQIFQFVRHNTWDDYEHAAVKNSNFQSIQEYVASLHPREFEDHRVN